VANESTRTVLISLGTGLGIALTKAAAAVLTGSPALAAEASHSLADTGNDLFLFVAQRRSSHAPDAQHPLGYGREAYFWALIAALGVLVAGAAFSLREGITGLIDPSATSSFGIAYGVLAVSVVFDLVSIRRSASQMIIRGRRYDRNLIQESRATSDSTLRAVFLEDAVAISGDLIAFAGLALDQITGSSIPQAVAAVLIGAVMIRAGLRLAARSHDYLVGAWAVTGAARGDDDSDFTQPIRSADEERVRAFLRGYPGVAAVREMLYTFVGPGQVWLVARISLDDRLTVAQVESLVRDIESGLKQSEQEIYRVDVVPIGGGASGRSAAPA
jgi:cation diffusion facilitator family transporter